MCGSVLRLRPGSQWPSSVGAMHASPLEVGRPVLQRPSWKRTLRVQHASPLIRRYWLRDGSHGVWPRANTSCSFHKKRSDAAVFPVCCGQQQLFTAPARWFRQSPMSNPNTQALHIAQPGQGTIAHKQVEAFHSWQTASALTIMSVKPKPWRITSHGVCIS
jgi:hypothetical protein